MNREYCVQIGDSLSDSRPLSRGVPQGSVLEPILFCIYTIELSLLLREHRVSFRLFADDTQFYLSINNIADAERILSKIMSDIKHWMDYKQLKMNESKTECIVIGKKKVI